MHGTNKSILEARQLSKNKRVAEAIALLLHGLERATSEQEREAMLLELGIVYNAVADFSQALNHFNAVLRMNPNHPCARAYVEMINGILNYYNKELLNP
jgi:tetratricopeptide (TPR) repeat protein